MTEKKILEFLNEKFKEKGVDFSGREFFIRMLSQSFEDMPITKINVKLQPHNQDGSMEDIIIENIVKPDCGCSMEVAGECEICRRTVCKDHKKDLDTCENCGASVCKKHSLPSFINEEIRYCTKCRFSTKRMFWK
jgi:5-methylthioribose kinase